MILLMNLIHELKDIDATSKQCRRKEKVVSVGSDQTNAIRFTNQSTHKNKKQRKNKDNLEIVPTNQQKDNASFNINRLPNVNYENKVTMLHKEFNTTMTVIGRRYHHVGIPHCMLSSFNGVNKMFGTNLDQDFGLVKDFEVRVSKVIDDQEVQTQSFASHQIITTKRWLMKTENSCNHNHLIASELV